jgi:sulfopyruvate decarboxylase subunit alpha
MKRNKKMTPSLLLYRKLRGLGIDFFVSVPCKLLAELIILLENDREIIYTPVAREEEGVGIMAGAFLAGKRPAIVMQNSGLGNCINAICSLANYYKIPLVFVISHRGTEGEEIDAQRPMGRATKDLLRAINVPSYEIRSIEEIDMLDEVLEEGFKSRYSVALLFPFSFWRGL